MCRRNAHSQAGFEAGGLTTEVPHSRRWRPTLWAVVATAFFVRLWNLGTFSPWLDEFVTLRFARLPFFRLLMACGGDAENVPLYAIVTHLGTRAGLADPWIRMPFILFGTAGIAALMLWVRQRLGTTAALAAGLVATLSPFHVRYSQEMRAYPLLLLIVPLLLLTAEKVALSASRRWSVLMAGLVVIGAYTHLSFWIVMPVIVAIVANPTHTTIPTRKRMQRTLGAIGAGGLLFLPWALAIRRTLETRLERGGTDWAWSQLGLRWNALTVAPWEGARLTAAGIVLLLVFMAGLLLLIRRRKNRWVVLAGLGSWLVWEGSLAAVGHWSDARYDLTLWFLIPLAIGAAAAWMIERMNSTLTPIVVFGTLSALILPGTWRYLHEGRPHWDVIADAAKSCSSPDEPIIAANEWTRVCLSWYIKDSSIIRPDAAPDIETSSALVVTGGLAPSILPELPQFNTRSTILKIPQTARLERLVRIPLQDEGGPSWWPPFSTPLPPFLSSPPRPFPERLFLPRQPLPLSQGLTLDLGSPLDLASTGLGPPRHRRDGSGFAWVMGHEAALILPPFSGSVLDLSVTFRPFHGVGDRQHCRILIDGVVVAEEALNPDRQTITVSEIPNSTDIREHLLVLQFSAVARPIDVRKGTTDRRELAAAIERIVVLGRG